MDKLTVSISFDNLIGGILLALTAYVSFLLVTA